MAFQTKSAPFSIVIGKDQKKRYTFLPVIWQTFKDVARLTLPVTNRSPKSKQTDITEHITFSTACLTTQHPKSNSFYMFPETAKGKIKLRLVNRHYVT